MRQTAKTAEKLQIIALIKELALCITPLRRFPSDSGLEIFVRGYAPPQADVDVLSLDYVCPSNQQRSVDLDASRQATARYCYAASWSPLHEELRRGRTQLDHCFQHRVPLFRYCRLVPAPAAHRRE